VDTDMIQNQMFFDFLGVENSQQMGEVFQTMNGLPIPWVEPIDISNAVLFLASEESRYITGLTLYVDAGFLTKVP
jgi:NAD(P)-dependent dehydrogenase (short-subunit alcohol dehydrogenase family)